MTLVEKMDEMLAALESENGPRVRENWEFRMGVEVFHAYRGLARERMGVRWEDRNPYPWSEFNGVPIVVDLSLPPGDVHLLQSPPRAREDHPERDHAGVGRRPLPPDLEGERREGEADRKRPGGDVRGEGAE